MSKQLKSRCKQVIFSVGAAVFLFNQAYGPSYLYAATVNANVSNTTNVVQIKDTTLTLKGMTDDPKTKTPVINAVVERASGLPDQAKNMKIDSEGKVTINGKSYDVRLYVIRFEKLSNTQANIQIGINFMGKENGVYQPIKGITAASLKNVPMEMSIKEIQYSRDLDKLSEQFKAQLKKATTIEGVTGEQAGMGFMNKGGCFIGQAGMNIPVFEGNQDIILDNIGFVKGRLMLRTEEKNDSFLMLEMQNAAGQYITETGVGLSNKAGTIHIYDAIKDATTLNKCKISAMGTVIIESDKETKVLNCKF